ncbi:MAG: methionyl-tRNA formyltransferase [Bacteroidales bacterium]|nr:methionyl-tRNA formyltransferase [Bacteroidales bacterium]
MKKGKIVFMGTPDFAVASLDAIVQAGYEVAAVVTVPDRQTGRGQKITFSPVKDYALAHNLPLLQPEKLRDPDFLEQLKAVGADLFVVVAFRMLPQVVWSMPPLGTFNLHASLLPQYRGAAPINWAIINGETRSGVTTFLLNEKIDEGQILLQAETPITPDDNAGTLHDRLAEMGKELVVKTVDGLLSGTLEPHPQTITGKLRPAPKIFRDDCNIDWSQDGETLRNFIRGLSPYPAAATTLVDDKGREQYIKIFDSEFVTCAESPRFDIVTDNKKWVKIGVKNGFLSIKSLQMSGKRKISVEEFLRGYNITNWKLKR